MELLKSAINVFTSKKEKDDELEQLDIVESLIQKCRERIERWQRNANSR